MFVERQRKLLESDMKTQATLKELDNLVHLLIHADSGFGIFGPPGGVRAGRELGGASVQSSSLTNELFSETFPGDLQTMFTNIKLGFEVQMSGEMTRFGLGDATDDPTPQPDTSKESTQEQDSRRPSRSQCDSKNKKPKGQSRRSAAKKRITRKERKDTRDVRTLPSPSEVKLAAFFTVELVQSRKQLAALCSGLISKQPNIPATILKFAGKQSRRARSYLLLADVYFFIATFSSQLLSAMGNIMNGFSIVSSVQSEAKILIQAINAVTAATALLELNFKNVYAHYLLRSLRDEVPAQPGKANERSEEVSQSTRRSTKFGHSKRKSKEVRHPKNKSREAEHSSQRPEQAGQSTRCKETGREDQLPAISQRLDTLIEYIHLVYRKLQHIPEPDDISSSTDQTSPPHSEKDDDQDELLKERFLKLEAKLSSIGEKMLLLVSVIKVLHRKIL
jgi:hypothetical protein